MSAFCVHMSVCDEPTVEEKALDMDAAAGGDLITKEAT